MANPLEELVLVGTIAPLPPDLVPRSAGTFPPRFAPGDQAGTGPSLRSRGQRFPYLLAVSSDIGAPWVRVMSNSPTSPPVVRVTA